MKESILRMWGRLGLYQKLSAGFLVVTVLPLLLTNAMILEKTELQMRRSVFEHFHLQAMNLADDLDQMLLEKARMMRVLASSPQVRSMQGKALETAIAGAVKQYPELAIVFVTDAKGMMVARSDGLPANIDYSDRSYYKEVLKTGKLAFSRVVTSRSTGKTVIVMAEPIRDDKNALIGLVCASYDIGSLVDRLNENRPGHSGEVYVVDKEGSVLIHSGREPVDAGKNVSRLEPVGKAAGGAGWVEYDEGGARKVAGYSHIPTADWGLVVQQPLDEAMAEIGSLRHVSLIIIVAAAVLAVLAGIGIARAVVRPLGEIAAAAEGISAGDASVTLDVTRQDEIGQLETTFNHMARQLEKRDEALRKSEERTRRQNEHLKSLHEISLGLVNRLDTQDLLSDILKKAGDLIGTSQGFIYLLNEEEGVFERKVGIGIYVADVGRKVAVGKGMVSQVVASGQPMVVDDYATWANKLNDPFFENVNSALQIPLKSGGRIIGTIGLTFREKGRTFSEEEVSILSRFADMASIAYDNAKLYGVVQEELAERKQAEAALRESELRLSQLIDFLPDATLAIDLQGRVTIWNRAMEAMTGVDAEDMLGKGDCEYSLPFYGTRRPQLIDLVFKSDEELEQKYQYVRREGACLLAEADVPVRGGEPRALWGVTCALYDGEGNAVGALESIRDVTDRKQAEEQTRKYALELERSNRDLEQFAYVSSHDLQEPLRKIIAFGDRLRGVGADSLGEKGLDYLDRMQASALRMRRLIDDLLAYSRVSRNAARLEKVDLGEMLKETLQSLEYRIEETGGEVEAGELPNVEADPVQMRQLFQNLIGNALKFHRSGVPPRVVVSSRRLDGGGVEILVADNGIGFDEKYLDRIFVPFQRLHTRTEFEGTGMGLAICQKIAERHGWTITAKSIIGAGTTFIVTVPGRK